MIRRFLQKNSLKRSFANITQKNSNFSLIGKKKHTAQKIQKNNFNFLLRKKFTSNLFKTKIARNFCSQDNQSMPVMDQETLQKKQEFEEEILEIDENNQVHIKFNDDIVSYEIPDELPGTTHDTMGNFMMMVTCSVCGTKQTKIFTKRAYYNGTVLVRCEGCPTVHLVADNLGWFDDEPTNIEKIAAAKGEEVKRLSLDPEAKELFKKKIEETKERSRKQREERKRNPQDPSVY